jgi:hypothetical protein
MQIHIHIFTCIYIPLHIYVYTYKAADSKITYRSHTINNTTIKDKIDILPTTPPSTDFMHSFHKDIVIKKENTICKTTNPFLLIVD